MKRALLVASASLFLGSAALAGELATGAPSEVGMSRLERLTQFFKADTDAKRLPGAVVMIARHGKVVYYEAFGVRDPATGAPMQKDSIFRIYSMTKPITGVAVLMLLEEGKLRLSDPISATRACATIAAGALQLGNGGTTGSIVGNVVDTATLAFDRSDAATFAGAISGSGSVSQIGSGATILTGANAYTGQTLVTAGQLYVDGNQSGATGPTSVGSAASLGGNGVIGGAAAFWRQAPVARLLARCPLMATWRSVPARS